MEDLDRVCTGVYSDVGKRSSQQDAARVSESYTYAADRRIIAVLCDGMGGLAGGERASGYCVEKMYEVFNSVNAEQDIPRFYGMMVEALDKHVKEMTNENGEPLGAGTTLVSVIVDDGRLYRASVGDSRIYIISDAGIMCLTRDHNYGMILNEQVKRGMISRQAAQEHPKREALISYIGMGGVRCADIDEKPFRLQDGDRILLCSDGLYRSLSEIEMAEIVRSADNDMEAAARMLVQSAVGKGKSSQDNTTAIVIKYLAM
jgi:protein phosphatase